jgi:hypothetical protein
MKIGIICLQYSLHVSYCLILALLLNVKVIIVVNHIWVLQVQF